MCLAIPGQIVDVVDAERRLARVDVAGVRRTINVALLDGAPVAVASGDWVLIHVGFAISRVDESEALATLELLERMGAEYQQEVNEIRASVRE
ncbi:MAG TPA: HypC/HybG/HupF family hydrogenase formation chaperone [Gemmatimonadaceae bacterium]|jgi:hydrogenase expression/formation protein HypC|nr:HypC/HybG/HupF family hydrogenase formation chaperone [Gemmatimonadaceae bacterium]